MAETAQEPKKEYVFEGDEVFYAGNKLAALAVLFAASGRNEEPLTKKQIAERASKECKDCSYIIDELVKANLVERIEKKIIDDQDKETATSTYYYRLVPRCSVQLKVFIVPPRPKTED